MRVSIVTFGKSGQFLFQYLEEHITDYCVVCFTDGDFNKWTLENNPFRPVYSYEKSFSLYKNKEIDAFIVPAPMTNDINENYIRNIGEFLITNGVNCDDIFYVSSVLYKSNKLEVTSFFDRNEFDYLEFCVTDKCNLNCKSCSHFAPIIDGSYKPNIKQTESDLDILKGIFKKIYQIRLLGGEPFICNELIDYIELFRKYYPDCKLSVVTNATLLKTLSEEMIRAIKENDVVISISYYPPLFGHMDEITNMLKSHSIRFELSKPVRAFEKNIVLKNVYDSKESFKNCNWKCTMLRNSRLYTCSYSALINYFNKYFGTSLPEEFSVELNSNLSSRDVLSRLEESMNLCAFCKKPGELIEWDRFHERLEISDVTIF